MSGDTAAARGVVVCADMDRTVIWSPTALALTAPDEAAPRLLCVEVYRGRPLSFVTEHAGTLLVDLARAAVLVPTTTRTPAQLARIHLPGPPPRWAIASNGGDLLVDGAPDADWHAHVRDQVGRCAPLEEVRAHLGAVSVAFAETLRTASDLFAYAVVRRDEVPDGWAQELAAWCAPRGWTVSLQGRKVYCVPAPLTKSAAAREVMRRTGSRILVAAGDSLLDAELLAAADLGVRPREGELADSGWDAPHVHRVEAPGVLGGEELVGWLLARVRATGDDAGPRGAA